MTKENIKSKNFKGEEFLDVTDTELKWMKGIANDMLGYLQTKDKYILANDIFKSSKKEREKTPQNKPMDKLFESIGFGKNAVRGKARNKDTNTKKGQNSNEYSGVYLFGNSEGPVYVGISRTLRIRMQNHCYYSTKEAASWAFLMIKHDAESAYPPKPIPTEKIELSKKIQDKQSSYIQECRVVFHPVTDPFVMAMLEIVIACHLKTKWNSFETH